MTLIPISMGTYSGHGMLVSAFSGNRGTALQVAFLVFAGRASGND